MDSFCKFQDNYTSSIGTLIISCGLGLTSLPDWRVNFERKLSCFQAANRKNNNTKLAEMRSNYGSLLLDKFNESWQRTCML